MSENSDFMSNYNFSLQFLITDFILFYELLTKRAGRAATAFPSSFKMKLWWKTWLLRVYGRIIGLLRYELNVASVCHFDASITSPRLEKELVPNKSLINIFKKYFGLPGRTLRQTKLYVDAIVEYNAIVEYICNSNSFLILSILFPSVLPCVL